MKRIFAAEARTGRDKQLYDENNVRQVAGCIPVDPETNRVLLITSTKHPNAWVFPKGGWENDETQIEAAERETYEEAGVRGKVTRFIGEYFEYDKFCQPKTRFYVYEMHIQEILKDWPEKKFRDRRWFTVDEAIKAVSRKAFMQDAIRVTFNSM
ncbi:hypothetical protein VTP01DRAFT_10387 [Rhizomucor pusillus]|uniref:uncharacterized protein n=1 Tax=Rhizomucor pusillus TaxID=4840 RepID=UPI003743FB7E